MISPPRLLTGVLACGLLVGELLVGGALAGETQRPIKADSTAFHVRIVRLVYRRPADERVYFHMAAARRLVRGGHR